MSTSKSYPHLPATPSTQKTAAAAPETYRGLNANQTPWQRLVSFYEANAEDRTSIIYTFPTTQLSIQILVHRKVPLVEFKKRLREFYMAKKSGGSVSSDDLEIRVTRRGARESRREGVDAENGGGGDDDEVPEDDEMS